MSSLLDVVDRAIVLNLPKRIDRRRQVEQELGQVWPGRTHQIVFYPAIDCQSADGFDSGGVRGCFLSHVALLNAAKNLGAGAVLVLEDDCVFTDAWTDLEPQIASQLQATNWDMVWLCAEGDETGPALIPLPADQEKTRAHCYLVSGACLGPLCAFLESILLRNSTLGPMHVDGAFNHFRQSNPDLKALMCPAQVTRQRPSRSDLMPRWFDRIPLMKTAAQLARSLKK